MADVTLPAHMLPRSIADAIVVVCVGPPRCNGDPFGGCPWCAVIDPAVDDIDTMLAGQSRLSS